MRASACAAAVTAVGVLGMALAMASEPPARAVAHTRATSAPTLPKFKQCAEHSPGRNASSLGVLRQLMLPMRDGVKLHTNIVSPQPLQAKKWPVVIDRSPYGGHYTELIADIFLLFDFVAVGQDMRGTCKSEGNFSLFHTDMDDCNDTVAWVLQQPWCDGRIFTVGASADGIGSLVYGLASPRSLLAQFVIFATGSAEETFYPGGAYRGGLIDDWLGGTVPKQASRLISTIRAEEGPGPYWDAVEFVGGTGVSNKFERVTWPSVMWAGWYDIFLRGNLVTFEGFQKQSQPAVRGKHYLVVDPCGHCQDAATTFTKDLIEGRVLLPILLGIYMFTGESAGIPEGVQAVTFYLMGGKDAAREDGNYWVTLADWPAFKPTPLYLHGNGTASFVPQSDPVASSSYDYDPAHPVPSNGGNNLEIKCGPLDQSKNAPRADVLEFTSVALTTAVFVTGPLVAELYVSSNATDTDFTMMLMDVYPDGQQLLVQDGIRRMRWRPDRGTAGPSLLEPGKVYKVALSLWNTSYAFAPGHRIKVAVSSSNAPRFEPNPNTGKPLGDNDARVLVARNTLHHSLEYPSSLLLPVVQRASVPRHNILQESERMAARLGPEKAGRLHAAHARLVRSLAAR